MLQLPRKTRGNFISVFFEFYALKNIRNFQEAKELLVEVYTTLRVRDSQSNTKNTWRITVRQLESLIRLSEAMAKMECSDEVFVLWLKFVKFEAFVNRIDLTKVLVTHVREAYQLLNKSIIRVEQPDINLDDDIETGAPVSPHREEGYLPF